MGGKKKKKRCEGISSSTCGKVVGKEMDVARGGDAQPRSAGASYKASIHHELLKSPAPLRCSHPVLLTYLHRR